MSFTIEYSKAKRNPSGNYTYLIYGDGHLIARYWHDFRGDEYGIDFLDGTEEAWPVGRMIDFVEGGGPQPLVLSARAVEYLRSIWLWHSTGDNYLDTHRVLGRFAICRSKSTPITATFCV